MSREAFERGDWQTVIESHPLESHDPKEWLRYGVALLQTLTTGPDAGRQQQQAALAFVQAQKEGATAEQVAVAQRQSVLISVAEALRIAGCNEAAQRVRLAFGQASEEATAQLAQEHPWDLADPSFHCLLSHLAGLYSLKFDAHAESFGQLIAMKQQLHERKIAIESVKLALTQIRQLEVNMPDRVIAQLLAVLA